MEKAAKLNFVSASQPVIEQPLPVGYSRAPSAELHSVKEQAQNDDNEMADEVVPKEDIEEIKQVCIKM